MRKLLVSAVAALAFLVPSSAHAVVFLGVRAGYAVPSGDIQKNVSYTDQFKSTVPVQIDAGMSVLMLNLGVYGSYGPSSVASNWKSIVCTPNNATCNAQNLRLGVQGFLRLPVLDSIWGGAFVGLEQQAITGGPVDVKLRGWEAGLQAGYDFSILPFIKVGPFASFATGQFQVATGSYGAVSITVPIQDKSPHNAFTLGLRGLFDL